MHSLNLVFLRALRQRKQKLLDALLLQAAKYGIATPAHIAVEIEELEQALAELDQRIAEISRLASPAPAKTWASFIGSVLIAVALVALIGIVILVRPKATPSAQLGSTAQAATPSAQLGSTAQAAAPPTQLSLAEPGLPTAEPSRPTTVPAAPEWMRATPTLAAPSEITIAADAANTCAAGLKAAIGAVLPGAKIVPASTSAGLMQAAGTRLSVHSCGGAAANDTTIWFSPAGLLPIPLLREPEVVTLTNDLPRAQIAVQSAALYSAGQYEQALVVLESPAAELLAADQRGGLGLFWGNILVRNQRWGDAAEAYTQALEHGAGRLEPTQQVALLNNRALARLLHHLAEVGVGEQCSGSARADAEEAIGLAPGRADLHILLGSIALLCPREGNSADIEVQAPAEAQRALELDASDARAYDLQALVGLENAENKNLPIRDPRLVEQLACQALQLDRSLAGPQRTLGILYARYGLAAKAQARFEQYARAARFAWQRDDAARRWEQADQAERPALPGLGNCAT